MSSLLVLNRVYRLEIQSAMLVFSTPLVNFLTGSPPTPLPLPSVNKYEYSGKYLYCGGREGWGLCGEHTQELYTVYLTRFRTYKIALPP
jgi:hypothetical protein